MVGAPAMTSSPMPHHGRAKSLVLHLAPGAFAFAVYLSVCLPIAGALGLPRYATLFALAHFHSPWGFPSRMLLLPVLIYAVQRTRSISVGIWAHCIGNTAGELLALTELLTAPSTPSQGF